MNSTYWDIITKKLGGDCTEEEKMTFEKLLSTDEQFKETYNDASKIWQTSTLSKYTPNSSKEVTRNFNGLLDKIDAKAVALEKSERPKAPKQKFIEFRRKWTWASIAASIIFIIGFYFAFSPQDQATKEPQIATHFSNPQGAAQKNINLPDGSTAMLMGGTSITWANSNTLKNERRLFLEGEAIFDVQNNAQKPFIVKTMHTSIKVLGTVFKVQAYKDLQLETVSVEEGRVEFTSNDKKVTLSAKEKASFVLESQEFTAVKSLEISDNSNRIFFDNIDLQSASIILENRFGKKIKLADKTLARRKIYGKFNRENLNEILQSISLALDIKYVIKEDAIVLSKK